MQHHVRLAGLGTAVIATFALLSACSADKADVDEADDHVVVYVGRNEELLTPLIEQFEEESGITVEARYAQTPELAATLLEEGKDSPADVFISQDAGALGALAQEGLLKTLPEDVTSAVPAEFTSTDGSWVGLTGRSRVIAYDGEELEADEVPDTVAELTEPKWKGRVAMPPSNASFQSFVTGFRVSKGDDAARTWLEDMVANDVQVYDNNLLILDALDEGATDVGLINHYYWFEKAAEVGEENMRAQLKFAAPGDPGALVNVTGAARLSDDPDADALVEFLVGEQAQTYFSEKLFEYPLRPGIDAPEGLPALTDLQGPEIDLADLADVKTSVEMIRDAGLG